MDTKNDDVGKLMKLWFHNKKNLEIEWKFIRNSKSTTTSCSTDSRDYMQLQIQTLLL